MGNRQDDPLRPTQDKRGFFMLPRAPSESGYYNDGLMDKKPDRGGYQYPHPIMMQAILRWHWNGTVSTGAVSGSGISVAPTGLTTTTTTRIWTGFRWMSGPCAKMGWNFLSLGRTGGMTEMRPPD